MRIPFSFIVIALLFGLLLGGMLAVYVHGQGVTTGNDFSYESGCTTATNNSISTTTYTYLIANGATTIMTCTTDATTHSDTMTLNIQARASTTPAYLGFRVESSYNGTDWFTAAVDMQATSTPDNGTILEATSTADNFLRLDANATSSPSLTFTVTAPYRRIKFFARTADLVFWAQEVDLLD